MVLDRGAHTCPAKPAVILHAAHDHDATAQAPRATSRPIRVLHLFTFLEIFVHESLLRALHFLLQLLYFPHLVVLVIPITTQVASGVFHVQTHREPRALTYTLHCE